MKTCSSPSAHRAGPSPRNRNRPRRPARLIVCRKPRLRRRERYWATIATTMGPRLHQAEEADEGVDQHHRWEDRNEREGGNSGQGREVGTGGGVAADRNGGIARLLRGCQSQTATPRPG